MPKSSVAWLLVSYYLSTACFMLVAAHLGNALGRRKLALLGIFIDLVALTSQFFMPSFWGLVGLRFLGGLGNSMVVTNLAPLTVRSFPDSNRGQVLGLLSVGLGIGAVVSAPVAGIVADNFGWRYVYLIVTIPYLALLSGVYLFTKESEELSAGSLSLRNFDYIGFILITGFLFFLTIGLQGVGGSGFTVVSSIILLLAIPAGIIFTLTERRAGNPLLPLELFRQLQFSAAVVRLFSFSLLRAALTFLLPFYFIDSLGWTGSTTGGVLIALNIGLPIIAPFSGTFADRIGSGKVIMIAFLIMLIGVTALISLPSEPAIPMVVGILALIGISFGLFSPPNQKVIYEGVPREKLSLAPGVQVLVAHSSNAIGSALAAMLLGLFLFNAIFTSYQWVMIVLLTGFITLNFGSIWISGVKPRSSFDRQSLGK